MLTVMQILAVIWCLIVSIVVGVRLGEWLCDRFFEADEEDQ